MHLALTEVGKMEEEVRRRRPESALDVVMMCIIYLDPRGSSECQRGEERCEQAVC